MAFLLMYTRLGSQELVGGAIWVAIVSGSPGKGGEGVVVYGGTKAMYAPGGVKILESRRPGDPFRFAANADFNEATQPLGDIVDRETHDLDTVPSEVAAAWMKLRHQGKLT